jgi:hypothetical protein
MTETKERASIANEIDMIEVRRTAEHDSFEVGNPRRKRRESSPRHDVTRDVRAADGGQAYAGALSRGGLPVLT